MKATVVKNGVTFEVEAGTLHDLIQSISIVTEAPTMCNVPDCKGKVRWNYRRVKGVKDPTKFYDYFGLICTKCGATKSLHLRDNEAKSEYWKYDEKFEKYVKPDTE